MTGVYWSPTIASGVPVRCPQCGCPDECVTGLLERSHAAFERLWRAFLLVVACACVSLLTLVLVVVGAA